MYIKTNRKFIFLTLVVVALVFATLFVGLNFSDNVAFADDDDDENVVTELLGSGTSENAPFFIKSVEEFVFFVEKVNNGESQGEVPYGTAFYKLDENLDLSGTVVSPIGTEEHPFNGKFDGDGKIISNYSLITEASNSGLFGYVGENGKISKLGVFNGSIDSSANEYVGGIVGYNQGEIESSFFYGTIEGFSKVGGIAGINEGTIRYSFASGKVTAGSVSAYVGGLVGKNAGTLTHSYSIAEVAVKTSSAQNFGGVIGGRTGESSTPKFSYFDNSFASYGGNVKAIGGGAADSYDQTAIEISNNANKVKGITDVELNDSSVADLFGAQIANQNIWLKRYNFYNHTAYAGPIVYAFRDNEDAEKDIEKSFTVRKFDRDDSSLYDWGSENNPYVINTEVQFAYLAEAVNEYKETYVDEYFALGSDIEFKSAQTPIGNVNDNTAFRGVFDGKYHTLGSYKNKTDSDDSTYIGIFGYIRDGARIKNLTVSATSVITGTEYVGSLVGYSENATVSNVETRATVSSFGNSGGLIGCINGGTYQNILSSATLVSLGASTSLYGIVGGYRVAKASSVANAWYFACLTLADGSDNPFTRAGDIGNTLCYDSQNGTITAQKDAEGNIKFTCTSIDDGFNVEYRTKDESIIYKADNNYAPDQDAVIDGTVYARFVKTLTYKVEAGKEDAVTLPDLSSFSVTYYVGQKITFPVTVKNGSYVSGIVARDKNGQAITLTKEQYSYDSERVAVILDTEMTEELSSFEVKADFISWGTGVFPTSRTYTGQEVIFPVVELSKPADYNITVSYNGGKPEVNANSGSDRYTLVVIYSDKNDVRMGSYQVSYRIEPKQLTFEVPGGTAIDKVLSTTKEWDNSFDPLPAEVDQIAIQGKCGDDDVIVGATMTFNTTDITTSAQITYTFTLSGDDKGNYKAPEQYILTEGGKITKRNVTISFVDGYESTYVQSGVDPSLVGKKWDIVGLVSSTDVRLLPSFTFTRITEGGDNGDVGEYKLTVAISSESGSASTYYNFQFKEEDRAKDGETILNYVKFTVNPAEVAVEYTVSGNDTEWAYNGDNLVYDGKEYTVTASYKDFGGATKTLTLGSVTNATSTEGAITEDISASSAMCNAGTYVFAVVESDYSSKKTDGNYKFTNPRITIVVDKAEQAELKLSYSDKDGNAISNQEGAISVTFGNTVTVTANGGSTDGAITYEVREDFSPSGSFEGNVLSFSLSGAIMIKVTKAGDDNYKPVYAEDAIIVNKASLTVSVNQIEITYGEIPEFTLSYGGSSDIPSGRRGIVVLVDGKKHTEDAVYSAGEHTLTLNLTEAVSDGYTFEEGTHGKLVVEKLNISVVANNASSIYGQELSQLTFTVAPEEVVLEGALSTDAKAKSGVGTYAIKIGDLEESNPNYNISFTQGEYTITPATLTVKMKAQTKKFGAPDPKPEYTVEGLVNELVDGHVYGDTAESIGLKVEVKRADGENTYLGEPTSASTAQGYATYTYSNKGISHTSDNYLKTVKFETSGLTIVRATPVSTDSKEIKATPGTLLSEISVPELVFNGVDGKKLDGTLTWEKSYETLDFKEAETLYKTAIFTPNDYNYDVASADVTIKVNPIRITVSFSGSGVTYDGSVHKSDVKYTFRNVREGDDPGAVVAYEGDFVNVGEHTVKISITNKNYVLGGTTTYDFKIKKAVLSVTIDDIEVVEGTSVTPSFYYEGFRGGDGEDDLAVKPSVDIPSVAGTYVVTPYGAKAENYEFSYLKANVKIYASKIESAVDEDDDNKVDATFDGKFDADTVIDVKDTDTSRILTAFNDAKSAYTALEDKSIYKYFGIKYSVGDAEITPDGEIYITFTLPENAGSTEELAFLTLSQTGELIYVRDVLIDGDQVKLNVTGASGVVIARTSETSSSTYIIIIIVAVVVVALIVFISIRIKKRKERRYIKYRD